MEKDFFIFVGMGNQGFVAFLIVGIKNNLLRLLFLIVEFHSKT